MNKRLITIFVCIAIFVLALVLGAVVFTINDVDILLSSEQSLTFDKSQILATTGIKQGQSIFTVDEKEAAINIEKTFPKLKVVKIERSFPNKVRVHLDVRKPIIMVHAINDEKYVILDRELKIIDVVAQNSDKYSNENITILNNVEINMQKDKDLIGEFLSKDNVNISALEEAVKVLETHEVVNERFSALFKSIDIFDEKTGLEMGVSLNTRIGLKIYIRTNASIAPAEQCNALYMKLYTMSSEELEKDNYLYFDDNGNIQNSSRTKLYNLNIKAMLANNVNKNFILIQNVL